MAVPDADVILGAFRAALPEINVSERGVRAAVQHARTLARWPLDEPAAIFFAFACRPKIAPGLGSKLVLFLVRDQLESLELQISATDEELSALRMDVLHKTQSAEDVLAWFAERIPAE